MIDAWQFAGVMIGFVVVVYVIKQYHEYGGVWGMLDYFTAQFVLLIAESMVWPIELIKGKESMEAQMLRGRINQMHDTLKAFKEDFEPIDE